MNKEVVVQNIKKNAVAITFGVIALIAVIADFYPLGGMQEDLKGEADKHALMVGELTTATNKKYFLPIIKPDQTEAEPLTVFPTPDVVTAGTNALTDLGNQSKALYESAVKFNDHSTRIYNKLPVSGQLVQKLFKTDDESGGIGVRRNFAGRYIQVLSHDADATSKIPDGVTLDDKNPNRFLVDRNLGAPALNLYNDVLHGGLPPNPIQISNASTKLYDDKYRVLIQKQGGISINEQKVNDKFRDEVKSLADRMKLEVSKSKKMYVDAEAIQRSQDIGTEQPPSYETIWYAQMSLWLQQDLCDGLAKANDGRTNILDARVKRLLMMRVPTIPRTGSDAFYLMPSPTEGQGGPGGGGGGGGGQASGGEMGEKPSPATEIQKIPNSFAKSPTGRASNGMYDVLQFQLLIDVDATQIKEVIKDLSDQKFITVTNLSVYNLDLTSEKTKGFIYGSGAVARLVIDGEALYLRGWTEPLMPAGVRLRLGLPVTGQGGDSGGQPRGGPGGGGMGGRGGMRQ